MSNLRISNIRAKSNAKYTCQECGSTELIHAHHQIVGDDSSIIVLCAVCHSKRHPNLPPKLFTVRTTQPYWENISAATLAKEFDVHPRTIYRASKRLNIKTGVLSEDDKALIRQSLSKWRDVDVEQYNNEALAQSDGKVEQYAMEVLSTVSLTVTCLECGGRANRNGYRMVRRKDVMGRRQSYICRECWYQWEDHSMIFALAT